MIRLGIAMFLMAVVACSTRTTIDQRSAKDSASASSDSRTLPAPAATNGTSSAGGASNAAPAPAKGGFALIAPTLPSGVNATQISTLLLGTGTCIGIDPNDPIMPITNLEQSAHPGQCLLQKSTVTYSVGSNLGLSNLAPGSYQLALVLLDGANQILMFGDAPVVVTAGTTTSVEINMQAYTSQSTLATGNIDIKINVPVLTPTRMLTIASTPLQQVVGACGAVTYCLRDIGNNPVANDAFTSLTFTPTSSAVSGAFYADAQCTAGVTTGVVQASQSCVNLYYADSVAGTPSLGATVDASLNFVATSPQLNTIGLSPVTSQVAFGLRRGFYALTRNHCGPMKIILANSFNQATSDSTFKLASSSAYGAFFSDSRCSVSVDTVTVPVGYSEAIFYYRDYIQGTPLVIVTNQVTNTTASKFVRIVN